MHNAAAGLLAAVPMLLIETPLVALAVKAVERRRWGLSRWRPSALCTLLGVLWLDYTLYLWHRAAHVQPTLWRLHLPHHLDPVLDTTTAWRFHPMLARVAWGMHVQPCATMMTVSRRRANRPSRLWTGAAIAFVVAALAGSTLHIGSVLNKSPPESQRLQTGPVLLGDFWGKPKPRCLHCHQQNDHRLDPSRRTAYARFTTLDALDECAPLPPRASGPDRL